MLIRASTRTIRRVGSHHHHLAAGAPLEKWIYSMGGVAATASRHMSSGAGVIGNDVDGARAALMRADAVCFDVDSTVITEEGIDVLADFLGKGEEVAAWTSKAMNGGVKFEDALAARLQLIEPSRTDIQRCIKEHPFQLSAGVADLIKALHSKQVSVWFVSGGFRIMIEPIAAAVGVSKSNILANTILFQDDALGTYAGFDKSEPTSADMGKPKAVARIKQEGGFETVVMVGDGATDGQAKPPANAFIGFGGVVAREAVKAKADWFVFDFEEMTKLVLSRP